MLAKADILLALVKNTNSSMASVLRPRFIGLSFSSVPESSVNNQFRFDHSCAGKHEVLRVPVTTFSFQVFGFILFVGRRCEGEIHPGAPLLTRPITWQERTIQNQSIQNELSDLKSQCNVQSKKYCGGVCNFMNIKFQHKGVRCFRWQTQRHPSRELVHWKCLLKHFSCLTKQMNPVK